MAGSDVEADSERTHLLGGNAAGGGASAGGFIDLGLDLAEETQPSSKQLYWNFALMCLGFSVNHGCVVSCLAYSTAELGTELGGYGSGMLYVCYALTALFLSKPLVAGVGAKLGLLIGVGGYCIYVAAFLVAVVVKDGPLAWVVFLTCCAIGGCAGGVLWTAQGRYFALNAKKYAQALSRERVERDTKSGRRSQDMDADDAMEEAKEATTEFAGLFAMTYLGAETLCKLSSTAIYVLYDDSANAVVFAVYAMGAIGATVVVTRLNHLNDHGEGGVTVQKMRKGALDAVRLVGSDARLALLVPYQMNFGIISTFVPYYVFGIVVANSSTLGGEWVGALSAIITATGAFMGLPAAWLTKMTGKAVPMTIGALATIITGSTVYFYSEEEMGTWGFIVPLLIIYGVGRGTWENTNKAVVAELYTEEPQHIASAFAVVSFANGFTGAIAYFVFPNLESVVLADTVVVFGVLAVACYYLSLTIDHKRD